MITVPLKNTISISIQKNWNLKKKKYYKFLCLFFFIFTFTLHCRLFEKRDNFGFDIVSIPFYCFNVPSKMFYESVGAEFLKSSRAISKIEDLSHNYKQLLSRMLKRNKQMRRIKLYLLKMIQALQ